MGTAFTIDVRDSGDWQPAVAEVIAWLHHVDSVFSTYRPDSDICRLQREELSLDAADPEVSVVLDLCAQVQAETGQHFSAVVDGRIDPTGLVKGWAIERASALLSRRGARNHAVNGGGDMQLVGEAASGRPWRVGITHPADRHRVFAVVEGRDIAVATSGTSERGQHIVDPFRGTAPTALLSATVVGPSLTRADAYATAAFVMGHAATTWLDRVVGYEGLLVAADGASCESAGWRGYATAAPAQPPGAFALGR
jgi:thiamine biosynthesis lipoprotein